jgi:hypothetical protein
VKDISPQGECQWNLMAFGPLFGPDAVFSGYEILNDFFSLELRSAQA